MAINIEELKETFEYIIDNNNRLIEQNKKPTALEIIGDSGIGKTSCVLQLAAERHMNCVKLNLAQLEELGDIIGFPIKEYEVCNKEGNCEWVAKDLLDYYLKSNYSATGEHRMGYALPAWLPKEESENGIILILDDFNRADNRFIQAVMELIDRREFYSWKLPKNCHIVLTSNPDNGSYNVNSQDNAQRTRYISFEMEFDINSWAKWAENEGIDSRGINFVLSFPELFDKHNGVQTINARSMVTFFNTISGIEDFSNSKNLALILTIAEGCFTSEENVVGNLFTTFIANKLDKLPTPNEILTENWTTMKTKLLSCLYDGDNYRADIASVLTTRLLNYIDVYFANNGKSDVVTSRLLELVEANDEKIIFAEDLIYSIIKTITTKHPVRTKKLLTNINIIKKITR